jgi:hypothetical protein
MFAGRLQKMWADLQLIRAGGVGYLLKIRVKIANFYRPLQFDTCDN